jgi:exodeoxyribonuclease-5
MYSKDVFKLSWNDPRCRKMFDNIEFDENIILLCGFNYSRVVLNKMIRDKLGFTNLEPYPNERVICLKNNHKTKLMNGQIGQMIWWMPEFKHGFRITINVDGEMYECLTSDSQFGKVNYDIYEKSKDNRKLWQDAATIGYDVDYFDYGYAISVHKSQGSEWDKVVLFEQRSQYWNDQMYARWFYTALTRARKKLFIISDFY